MCAACPIRGTNTSPSVTCGLPALPATQLHNKRPERFAFASGRPVLRHGSDTFRKKSLSGGNLLNNHTPILQVFHRDENASTALVYRREAKNSVRISDRVSNQPAYRLVPNYDSEHTHPAEESRSSRTTTDLLALNKPKPIMRPLAGHPTQGGAGNSGAGAVRDPNTVPNTKSLH
jgi:hypothetical protein